MQEETKPDQVISDEEFNEGCELGGRMAWDALVKKWPKLAPHKDKFMVEIVEAIGDVIECYFEAEPYDGTTAAT
jgi:hypothetical protein